jgi:hypothetical protein
MSMTRAPLIPLLRSLTLDAPVAHTWDNDDPLAGVGMPRAESEAILSAVGDWGKLVYSLGCAEWVLARLARFVRADWPWLFRDACWAFELDGGFMLPPEIEDHPQEGPVDGPVCLALTTVLNTRYGFDERNAQIDASIAEQIALHILPDQDRFIRWRDTVLGRLERASAGKEPAGQRLSMSILDTDASMPVPAPPPTTVDLQRLVLENNPYARRLASFRPPD